MVQVALAEAEERARADEAAEFEGRVERWDGFAEDEVIGNLGVGLLLVTTTTDSWGICLFLLLFGFFALLFLFLFLLLLLLLSFLLVLLVLFVVFVIINVNHSFKHLLQIMHHEITTLQQ